MLFSLLFLKHVPKIQCAVPVQIHFMETVTSCLLQIVQAWILARALPIEYHVWPWHSRLSTRNHVQSKNSTMANANPSNSSSPSGQQKKTKIENILQFSSNNIAKKNKTNVTSEVRWHLVPKS